MYVMLCMLCYVYYVVLCYTFQEPSHKHVLLIMEHFFCQLFTSHPHLLGKVQSHSYPVHPTTSPAKYNFSYYAMICLNNLFTRQSPLPCENIIEILIWRDELSDVLIAPWEWAATVRGRNRTVLPTVLVTCQYRIECHALVH